LKQKKQPVLDITGFFFRMSTQDSQVKAEVRSKDITGFFFRMCTQVKAEVHSTKAVT
jgi:hypothetical protein